MDNRANFALTTALTTYDESVTTIDVINAAVFPAAPFNATWWNQSDYPNPSNDPQVEIVRVTNIAGNTLTIQRGQEGTNATVKNVGTTYMLSAGITAKTLDDIETELAAKRTYPQVDADKLATIESGATSDQSGAEIKAAYEGEDNTNAFTDAEKTKLSALEDALFLGVYTDLSALQTAHASPAAGSYAYIDAGNGTDILQAIWDDTDSAYVVGTGTGSETPASIKSKYESNTDTNALTDADAAKLGNVPADTNSELADKASSADLALRKKITYSDTAPSNPEHGEIWYKTDEVLPETVRSEEIFRIVKLTQAAYDALPSYDPNTLYLTPNS